MVKNIDSIKSNTSYEKARLETLIRSCYLVLPIQWGQALYPCTIAFIKEVNNSRSSAFISSTLHLRVSSTALWTILLLVLQI